MKELKRLTAASFVVLVLTVSTYAGIIDAPAPPPPPPAASLAAESDEISSARTTQGLGMPGGTITDVALNLLQELLLVF